MRSLLDASAVVDLLLGGDRGQLVRDHLAAADEMPLTVAHLDAEVFSALARWVRAGDLTAEQVEDHIAALADIHLERLPITGDLLSAAWSRRHNVTAMDSLYVAAAIAADCMLVTTDERLARAVPDLAVAL